MYYKKLIGTKCYLSPIDINDAEKYAEWLNDLEVTSNLNLYASVINTETEKSLLEKLSKEHHYAIIDCNSDDMIGTCGFLEVDHLNQAAEIGIFIGNKKFWNKGFGTESLRLLLDYGFKALNLHNVMLKVYSFNERAVKSYQKTGFKIMGKRREALKRGNKTFDIIYMDITYGDFYGEAAHQ